VIGSGRQNTRFNTESGSAAQRVTQLDINGFNDWFLPSRNELSHLYGNLHLRNLGNFRNEWYWSSTGYARGNQRWFWAINMANGNNDTRNGTSEFRVRPIRQVPGPN